MTNKRKLSFLSLSVALTLACLLLLASLSTTPADAQGTPTWPTLVPVALTPTFDEPMFVTHAGDGSGRIFIVEKDGFIRIISAGGTALPTPFLNIDALVGSGGSEQGLLSMAFSPDYPTTGNFYVNYTNNSGDTVIARYSVSGNPDVADPASGQTVLFIDQPFSNHNGGQLQFGPDGMLYIGMGDGGSGGDPGNRAQNPAELLGKMLRIDVETGDPVTYTIPADNPFINQAGYRDEIWQMGLRNPWRYSFDRQTGDLYIADVGQGNWEEIDFQPAASDGGENWGWRCYEGDAAYNTTGCQPASAYDFPVWDYNHSGGRCSITGGYVYRGTQYPRMNGIYFYADYCSGQTYGLQYFNDTWVSIQLHDFAGNPTSFGEDEVGNVYAATQGGTIYRLTDPSGPGPTPSPTATTVPPTPTATTVPATPTATEPPTAVEMGTLSTNSSAPVAPDVWLGLGLALAGVVGLLLSLRRR